MGRGGRHRDGARGALLDQSADLAAGDRPAARGVLRARYARLEPVAGARAGAAVSSGVRAVQVARFLGFRHRRAGRHGVPHHGRRLLDPRSRLPHAHRGRVHPALQGDRAGRLPHQLQLRGEGQAPRGKGGVARRQPVSAAAGRSGRRVGVAVRQGRWAAVDRKRRQAHRRDVRRRRQAAHAHQAGRRERRPAPAPPTGTAAEVPAFARRLRRVDRGVQGRAACGLDLRRPRRGIVVDGPARVSRGTAGPGAGDQPGERPSDEREHPGRVHPSALSVGVELVADDVRAQHAAPLHSSDARLRDECALLGPMLAGLTGTLSDNPLLALVTLFGAGLVTSLTPCIYPMIPITAGILAGTGAGSTSRARAARLTFAYVAGLALFYAILGLVAGLTGSLFGTVSASPWARFAIGNLLLVFGLAMLDVFPVSAPQRLLQWAGRLTGGSYSGVFLLGATSGIVAAPCGAPAFAAVLTWVATTRSATLGFIYLFVFSLGMTALLVVVGVSSGSLAALPRAGAWTLWIKKVAGVALLAMAEYYFVQMGTVL